MLEGMLRHSVLREAEELRGPHATALNRIANQVGGNTAAAPCCRASRHSCTLDGATLHAAAAAAAAATHSY